MSGIVKFFLLLTVMIAMAKAQMADSGQCLCQRVRNETGNSAVKDIQIYPATIFCETVEIVVTTGEGQRYCLNPQMPSVRKLVVGIIKKKKNAAKARPTDMASSVSSSSTTARV